MDIGKYLTRKKVINILLPNQIESIPQNLVDLFNELETFVITDISRRIKKSAEITETAEWQKSQGELIGIRNINQKVASILKLSDKQIESLFPDVALMSFKAEMEIYKAAKYKTLNFNKTEALQNYMKAAIKATKGDIENLTKSLGFAQSYNGKIIYDDLASFYHKQLNLAHVKVSSGVSDYRSAVKDAVKKISQSGLRVVYPETNWSNNVDVAVRRAVLTGVHQMNQEQTNYCLNELVPKDEQYAETTAHENCRPSHQNWQGRIFKIHGSTKDYPNLVEATKLGDVQGLEGANCHHSYFTFLLGASVRTYTDEQLKNINTPDFEYKGKTYTGYEATQYQRKIETSMREVKRELIGLKETGLDEDFKSSSIRLNQLKKEYKDFSEVANIRQKLERSQVQGFDRSISQQAVNAAKK